MNGVKMVKKPKIIGNDDVDSVKCGQCWINLENIKLKRVY